MNRYRTMASVIPFKLADIGEGIAEVELMKWFVQAGDKVKAFDRICEVQSDKATVQITSRYDGTISVVHYKEGDIVKVGAALVDISTDKGGNSSLDKKLTTADPDPQPLPAASHYKPAASVTPLGPAPVVDEADKILTTPAVRRLAKEHGLDLRRVTATGPGDRITKEDVLRYIQMGGLTRSPVTLPPQLPRAAVIPPSTGRLQQQSQQQPHKQQPASKQSVAAAASSSSSKGLPLMEDVKVPVRGVQRLMVKSMTAAAQVQHLTLCDEVGFDATIQLRDLLRVSLQQRHPGLKFTHLPLLVKAVSMALLQFPHLNATVNTDCSEVTHHASHNIGIAMDTPKGLVVPVMRSVQAKTIVDIALELATLQAAAQQGTLTEGQLSGGTFTLSNVGSIGGSYATPVLVVPQVMIGAFGRSQLLPRYVDKKTGRISNSLSAVQNGEAEARPASIMSISWSADHRVVDGGSVAKFSNLWKHYVEQPALMIADLR